MEDPYKVNCPECGEVVSETPSEPDRGLWTCSSCQIGFNKSGEIIAGTE